MYIYFREMGIKIEKKKKLLQLGGRSALILVDATDKGYVCMGSLAVLWARSMKNKKK